MPARYFYDCEFIEDGRTIELVSIGVVAQDGREYYAVSTDFDPQRASSWVRAKVLCQLPPPADAAWKPARVIRDELLAFFTAPRQPVELWAWLASYDHVLLAQLWGTMPELPTELPKFTREIRQHWELAGRPQVPSARSDRHHALADARLAFVRWQAAQAVLADKLGR